MTKQARQFLFEEEARAKLLAGIDKLNAASCITLGPKGRNVGLDKSWGPPEITNDGNSIVKEISVKDPYENLGISMAKEAAEKVKDKCGDGTTTVMVLVQAIAAEGIKLVSAGASPIKLKRGIDRAVEVVLQALDSASAPVSSNTEIQDVATVSASGSQEIGRLIAQAVEKVGKSGVITVEEGKSTETVIDHVDGMQFDRGFVSAYFATNPESLTVQMHQPSILVTDRKISSIQDILPLLQGIAASGKELLIIAEDVDGEALSTLVYNRLRGMLKVAAVKAPSFGDRRKAILGDIAALVGAEFASDEMGLVLKEVQLDQLGTAQSVTITADLTTIVAGGGDKRAIAERIRQIEAEESRATTSYEREKLQERRAKLGGGVAVIRVGSVSESAMKQCKQMVEDSLSSTKAAMEAGVVAGGGLALFRAAAAIDTLSLQGDELQGARTIARACEAPLRQIVRNAGLNPAAIVAQIKRESSTNMGFNALTERVEDLIAAGIQDPTKVVKSCLLHAASLTSIVLLSEVLVVDAPEEEIA